MGLDKKHFCLSRVLSQKTFTGYVNAIEDGQTHFKIRDRTHLCSNIMERKRSLPLVTNLHLFSLQWNEWPLEFTTSWTCQRTTLPFRRRQRSWACVMYTFNLSTHFFFRIEACITMTALRLYNHNWFLRHLCNLQPLLLPSFCLFSSFLLSPCPWRDHGGWA